MAAENSLSARGRPAKNGPRFEVDVSTMVFPVARVYARPTIDFSEQLVRALHQRQTFEISGKRMGGTFRFIDR